MFSAASSSSVSAERPANVSARSSSAEQPATSLRSAEQPLSSFAPHLNNLVEQLVSDAGGEMQPNKRCKHDGMMVSSKDFTVPEIHQPITAALAEEINKFKVECEQWDPPTFGEDATEEDKSAGSAESPNKKAKDEGSAARKPAPKRALPPRPRKQPSKTTPQIRGQRIDSWATFPTPACSRATHPPRFSRSLPTSTCSTRCY